MTKKYYADIVINREKLSDSSLVYVANCTNLGIASQGSTIEEAMKNIKEAITLYLEEQPDKYVELEAAGQPPIFSIIEVTKNEAATSVR